MTATITITHKTCSACKAEKPVSEFSADAGTADGLRRRCKDCIKASRSAPRATAPVATEDQPAGAPAGRTLASMPITALIASLTNPRKHFNAARLAELADSIKAGGLHQPILVRPLPASRMDETSRPPLHPQAAWPFQPPSKKWARPTHEIIAGERRFRAAQLAGLAEVPVLVTAMNDRQVLEFQLVENLQREDLHPMEEAEGYQRLCETTGIDKEAIGDKIGKSRSYVYQRLKLLDLCSAAREAFGEGAIDMSRALVIARCPDTQLQQKALDQATKPDWQGEVPSARAFQSWAQQNIMLKLDAARFKITDASLVPEAGSCKECPKRTGAAPDLFADVKSADVCTDPKCFHAKEAAHDEAILAKAKDRGQRVIDEKEAKRLWKYESSDIDGYVRLDKPDYRVDSRKALKTVLGKDIPEPILIANPHKGGELVEVLPRGTVSQLLQDRGKITASQVRGDRVISESEAKHKALDKYERTWRRRAMDAINREMAAQVHGSELHADVLRMAARELVGGLRQDERAHVCELLGLGKVAQADAIRDHIDRAEALQAEQAMCLLLMQHDMINIISYGSGAANAATRIEAVARAYDVDLLPIQAAVKAEMKADAADKAAKAKKTIAPPAAGADGARVKPKGLKAGAKKKAEPKTTAAAARAGIAAALRDAEDDGEQDQAPDGAGLARRCTCIA